MFLFASFVPVGGIEQQDPQILNLLKEENIKDLPIGAVDYYPVPDARGTAIFIPQYHRNPASQPEDAVNDRAAKTQGEIHEVMDFLIDNYDLDIAVVEGELYGEVPQEKINKLAEQVSRNKPTREIMLQGAPQVLKAQGKNLRLFGAENKATLEESRILVRDYVMLSDLFLDLGNLAADNPYQYLLKEKEQEIEKVVVEKRNLETSQNFTRILEQENKDAGILVFGAGHREGLIKELNRSDLSVIVITVDEVAKIVPNKGGAGRLP